MIVLGCSTVHHLPLLAARLRSSLRQTFLDRLISARWKRSRHSEWESTSPSDVTKPPRQLKLKLQSQSKIDLWFTFQLKKLKVLVLLVGRMITWNDVVADCWKLNYGVLGIWALILSPASETDSALFIFETIVSQKPNFKVFKQILISTCDFSQPG